jgi:hypothetical protein
LNILFFFMSSYNTLPAYLNFILFIINLFLLIKKFKGNLKKKKNLKTKRKDTKILLNYFLDNTKEGTSERNHATIAGLINHILFSPFLA